MGAGATSPERAYPSRFGAWINATFPHADHVLANRGIGGTSSGIFAVCAEKMLPAVSCCSGLRLAARAATLMGPAGWWCGRGGIGSWLW